MNELLRHHATSTLPYHPPCRTIRRSKRGSSAADDACTSKQRQNVNARRGRHIDGQPEQAAMLTFSDTLARKAAGVTMVASPEQCWAGRRNRRHPPAPSNTTCQVCDAVGGRGQSGGVAKTNDALPASPRTPQVITLPLQQLPPEYLMTVAGWLGREERMAA